MNFKTVAFASLFGIFLVCFLMSLAVNVNYYYYYGSTNSQSKTQTENYADQVADLQNQTASLNSQLQALTQEKADLLTQLLTNATQIQNLNAQIAKVQSQLDYFKSRIVVLMPFEEQGYLAASDNGAKDIPFLITRLGSNCVQGTYGGSNRLFVQGTVYNIGTATATNCRLHVVLYQVATAVRDMSIGLGTLHEYDSVSVSQNIQYYSSGPLTNWTIDIQYS